jgi:DNA-binding NtrC family response regulator
VTQRDEHTAVDERHVVPESNARRFAIAVADGPARGVTAPPTERCTIGSHPSNDLVVQDSFVSRFHCEVTAEADGPRLRDVGSTNATWVDGVQVHDALLRDGSAIRIGQSTLVVSLSAETAVRPISNARSFGGLVGESLAIRSVFARLERAASSDATVLIEGETGTGKEAAAEAVHAASARRDGPFVVVDLSALPGNLLESELFGHEKGAFTGATERRIGAFEEASGGTVFLDEIGELPLELQPKLLRVLEQRTIRRLGSNARIPIDVRIVAATNADLRRGVNDGRFRPDLYYRLAVVRVELPPLRERPDDIHMLADRLLEVLGADAARRAELLHPDSLTRLRRRAWPGNVRELRNQLESWLVMDDAIASPALEEAPVALGPAIDPRLTYEQARRRALTEFERAFAPALVAFHGGNVGEAAKAAGMDRAYLYRLLRRHRG